MPNRIARRLGQQGIAAHHFDIGDCAFGIDFRVENNGALHAGKRRRKRIDGADAANFTIGALGATNKMMWSEMHQQAMELALDIYGPAAMLADVGPETGSWPAALRGQGKGGYKVSPMVSTFFFSRSETIWGGTSQIQRNIVGERVLGLPKEPKVAKD